MDTRVEPIENAAALEAAGELIRSGGLVAFATETVYGLGASAFLDEAVRAVFRVKGRPQDNPLIVHVDTPEGLAAVCARIPRKAEKLAARFMPGPLTMVLPKKDGIAPSVSCGLQTVAVRVPEHPGARAFLKTCGVPVAAPSANTSSRPSPTTARHVADDLNGKIPLILDGGDCRVGIESTVVDMTKEIPVLLRPGIISLEELQDAVGEVSVKTTAEGGRVLSPGMKYKHYAPKCDMVLARDNAAAAAFYMACEEEGKCTLLLCFDDGLPLFQGMWSISMGKDPKEAAHTFYRLLRENENDCDMIVAVQPQAVGVGASLYNRMIKSSGNRIV